MRLKSPKDLAPLASLLLSDPKIVVSGLDILGFNILRYHRIAHISRRRYEVASCPKMSAPKLLPQLAVILQ